MSVSKEVIEQVISSRRREIEGYMENYKRDPESRDWVLNSSQGLPLLRVLDTVTEGIEKITGLKLRVGRGIERSADWRARYQEQFEPKP